jgi:hypothetical protein
MMRLRMTDAQAGVVEVLELLTGDEALPGVELFGDSLYLDLDDVEGVERLYEELRDWSNIEDENATELRAQGERELATLTGRGARSLAALSGRVMDIHWNLTHDFSRTTN